jgi:very-short-patch-repair endonuclease
VVVHRTRRMPESWGCQGLIRLAPVERAVADAARGLSKLSEVRAVVAGAVQQRKCTIRSLGEELAEGPTRGSAQLRNVLAEVIEGIRSPAEADFRTLIRRSGLPAPLFNADLFIGGQFLARPDAWWPEAGLVAEVDSREWHLSPEDWQQTMLRHDRLVAAGIKPLHFTPKQIRDEQREVLRLIAAALRAGRPVPGITWQRAAA